MYVTVTIALGACINEVFPLLALGIALYFFIDRNGLLSMLRPKDLLKRTYLALYALVSAAVTVVEILMLFALFKETYAPGDHKALERPEAAKEIGPF